MSEKKIITDALKGTYVNLREVTLEDAEFILMLRCDEKKSRFLHKTENNLEKQIEYLKKYFEKDDEWYFIIERKSGERIGTIRIYDLRPDSFCSGSWIMIDGVSTAECFESTYITYKYGFKILGFEKQHIDVRKENKGVLKFHKTLGAVPTGETELSYLFEYRKDDYMKKAKLMCNAYGITE